MGLVGVSSPLPIYFSEYVARHEENGRPLIDFLNIFNHRCYVLFYLAWKKYRASRALSAGISDPFVRRIALLAGISPAGVFPAVKGKAPRLFGHFCRKKQEQKRDDHHAFRFFRRAAGCHIGIYAAIGPL